VGYAISRAAVTRTNTGASTVNSSNFTVTALSVGLSNAYLFPEFVPDFKRWLQRIHL
jgi:urocanate hydratase